MATTDRVDVEFLAEDNVTRILKQIEANTRGFTKTVETEGQKQSKVFTSLQRVVETALGFSFASVLNSAGAAFRRFVTDGIKDALQFERQFQALEAQVGRSADNLIASLREATRGQASDFELLTAANKALALGIEKDSLPALAKTAQALGKITGRSASEAFQDITTGIGRASPLILDNLGIVFDVTAEYEKYAETLGKTGDQLSKFEQKQALVNATIESSAPVVAALNAKSETSADKFERFGAVIDNLKVKIGENFIDGLTEIQQSFSDLPLDVLRASEEFQNSQRIIDIYSQDILTLTDRNRDLNTELKATKENLEALFTGKTQEEIDQQIALNAEKLKQLELEQRLSELEKEKFTPTAEGEQSQSSQIAQIEREIQASKDAQEQIRSESELTRQQRIVAQDEIKQAAIDAGAAESDAIAQNVTDLKDKFKIELQAYDDIKSKIELNNSAIEITNGFLSDNLEKQQAIVDSLKEEVELRRELAGFT